jgi:hypothetical protein
MGLAKPWEPIAFGHSIEPFPTFIQDCQGVFVEANGAWHLFNLPGVSSFGVLSINDHR